MWRNWWLGPALLVAVGCPAPDGNEPLATAGEPDEMDAGTFGSDGAPAPDPDPAGSSMGAVADETGTGCGFICPDDQPPPSQCDAWAQDCPEGEKCVPFANDGGPAWNALRCVALSDDPAQLGDACQVEGSGVTGVDDCDIGLFCWNVDEAGQGTCVQQCTGSAEAPICDNPDSSCVIANDGVLSLCLVKCDPLVQDCAEGQACYGTGESFACVPDASGPDLGAYGEPCEFTNACDPGLFCGPAEVVPGCGDSMGCCSEFCDLAGPDPDAECSGADQICEPWYADGNAPPGWESVGGCVLPS